MWLMSGFHRKRTTRTLSRSSLVSRVGPLYEHCGRSRGSPWRPLRQWLCNRVSSLVKYSGEGVGSLRSAFRYTRTPPLEDQLCPRRAEGIEGEMAKLGAHFH